jgi:hypothetical protein
MPRSACPGCRDAVAQRVGDQVAQGRLLLTDIALAAGVLACDVAAALERGGDVAGDLADRLVADDLRVGQAASTVFLTSCSTGYCVIRSASLVVTRAVFLAELLITLRVAVS